MQLLRKRSARFFAGLLVAGALLASPGAALADWDQTSTTCVYYTETAGACWVTWVNDSTGGRIDRWYGFWGNSYELLAEFSQ
jgi:hypothetical protein